MSEEIKNEDEKEEKLEPIEVTMKKEKETPTPDFDYDNYLPSEDEILEAEKELHETIKKRYVTND